MGTELSERKNVIYKPLLDDKGEIVTVQVVKIDGNYLHLDKAIIYNEIAANFLVMHQRETEMFAGIQFPVTIEIGIDGKKLRPNRIIVDKDKPIPHVGTKATLRAAKQFIREQGGRVTSEPPTVAEFATVEALNAAPEPTFHVGDKVGYRGESLPIPNSDQRISKGDFGVITDVIDGVISVCFEGMFGGTSVTVKPDEIQLIEKASILENMGVEGTHPAAPEADELAKLHKVNDELTSEIAKHIYALWKAEIKIEEQATTIAELEADNGRFERAQKAFEAAETTSPLPIAVSEYEHLTVWDTTDSMLDAQTQHGWELVHIQGMDCGGSNRLLTVWRRIKPNGKPTLTAVADTLYKDEIIGEKIDTTKQVVETHAVTAQTDVIVQAYAWGGVDRSGGSAGWRRQQGIHFAGGNS